MAAPEFVQAGHDRIEIVLVAEEGQPDGIRMGGRRLGDLDVG